MSRINPTSAIIDRRFARQHRRRKPPFYMRRQCSILQRHQRETAFDEIDIVNRGAYWKCLHTVDDRIASGFDEVISINPDIMMMFGCD